MALDHHGWHSHPPNARLSAHDGGIEGDATEKFLRLGASITLDMRNPISAAVLRRDDARPHSLPSAAAQRIGALLLDGDDGPAVVARKGALATLACCGFFLLIVRTDFHAANSTGFLATPTIGASGSHEVPTEDPRMRLNSNFGAMAAAVALSIGGQAVAQDAVQWGVADGGNGHWYRLSMKPLSFEAARQQSAALGGHLVTYSISAEQNHVWQQVSPVVSPQPFFIGAYQVPNSCEPGCGWRWVTDEPFSYTAWLPGAPNDNLVNGNEDAVCINADNRWNDLAGQLPIPYVTEWSADCNNDGIVDYGQIKRGELPDYNGNNIPDCCEQGSACVVGSYPVQWRVADGGNGHWYQGVGTANGIGWASAQVACVSAGGSLVSIGIAAESSWLYETIAWRVNLWSNSGPFIVGPWIGARGASGNWRWDDGTPWNYSAWSPGEGPPSGDPREQFAHFFNGVGPVVPNNSWGDYFDEPFNHSYIIEWSADCNNDGLVDYGQILAGELADANLNNIPDCCEGGASCNPCPGDVDNSGAVNGVDLAAILNSWGTSGGKYPGADVNHDSVVNGSDLAIVLNGWGPCP